MATKKRGKQTIQFTNPPVLLQTATIVGPKEGEGPLKPYFDCIISDRYFGQETWEKAESKMLEESVKILLEKNNLTEQDIDFMLAGDLLNQTVSANFAARQVGIPFLGLYGACSTMYEGLILSSILVDGGFASKVIASASSHHDTAERQFRFPTELGVQRNPTSQWTVTGAAAVLVADSGAGPRITYATIGKVIDLGQKDASDMGSAMAPAAADTIATHFQDTGRNVDYYDLIITGDLATIGKMLVTELLKQKGFNFGERYNDCGVMIYYPEQDVHAGGSGCACSAVVTCGYLYSLLQSGTVKKILGVGTGALMSPITANQGESIPGIAHAVAIEM